MKYINYFLLILFLTLINSSCLETLSGDNTKSIIPGLTIPVSDETEIAGSVKEVHDSADISSEIFGILGPLAGLMGSSVSSLSANNSFKTEVKNIVESLGEHDPFNGRYKNGSSYIYFKDGSKNVIILDLGWLANYGDAGQPLLVYADQDINIASIDVAISSFTDTMYLPGAWKSFNSGAPKDWLPTNYAVYFEDYDPDSAQESLINDFIENSFLSFRNMSVDTIDEQEDRTIELKYDIEMGESLTPSDADPVLQTGSGTITLHNPGSEDLVLTIKSFSMYIGTNGPISGSIILSRSDGYDINMSYREDGSSYSEIKKGGKLLATVTINADGSGTYTDSSGKTYPLS